jgi:two-component system alkaline phosphatase synthesis response regulator PhoP
MRKKILLVDDTVTVTTLEKIILGTEYDYVEARNGVEAFDRALAERPDLILMDLNMPVKNGIDSLRELKSEATLKHIPVVIVTTRGEPAAIELCRSLGCAEFITKPLDRVQLLVTVKKLLDGGVS